MSINTRMLFLYYLATFVLLLASDLVGYALTVEGVLDLASEVNGLESLHLGAGLTTALFIFEHNSIINLAISIPFLGPIAYVFSLGETGLVLGYAAASLNPYSGMGIYGPFLAYTVSALFPHGLLELLAYSISLYASMDVSLSITRHERVNPIRWLILLSISMVVLLAAAALEALELGLVRSMGL
ncbi:hypothetical protein GCM10007981_06750 [Thermocladium modestius]|uniref:Stage II sporulation protein M n=1 Tax=Thermocladium modestius TaxID=62609 RepID=A0A830GVN4_9CREN|nr:stage II sporulation protein M [Thermocladium modestius]GGP20088.1 hypothetical protein GCM10007981_06750 [Thermocladium modestius]